MTLIVSNGSFTVAKIVIFASLLSAICGLSAASVLQANSVAAALNSSIISTVAVGSNIPVCLSLNVQQDPQTLSPKSCKNMPFQLTLSVIDQQRNALPSIIESVNQYHAVKSKNSTSLMEHSFRAGGSSGSTCFNVYALSASTFAAVSVSIIQLTETCFEQCSDGNAIVGDGCDENGNFEGGFACSLISQEELVVNSLDPVRVHSCTTAETACPHNHVARSGSCVPARLCSDVLEANCSASSGTYSLMLGNDTTTTEVYCDMETEGGPWMLVSKFEQNGFVNQLSQSDYESYFKNQVWIKGHSQGIPTIPGKQLSSAGVSVQSLDWRKVLGEQGNEHRLRQKYENFDQGTEKDVHYAFTYGGVVTQNDAGNDDSQKKWNLTDFVNVKDTTGQPFQQQSEEFPDAFFLPYQPGFSTVWCPTSSTITSDGCDASNEDFRRFGNAGVMRPGSSNAADSGAFTFAPLPLKMANSSSPLFTSYFDWAWKHTSHPYALGKSGDSLSVSYWISEGSSNRSYVPPICQQFASDECALSSQNNCHSIGGTCTNTLNSFKCACKDGWMGDGFHCVPVANCSSVLAFNSQASNGMYHVLGTANPGQNSTAFRVYCDMATSGGPWALVSKFVQNGYGPSGMPTDHYNSFFVNGAWIHGDSYMVPYNAEYIRNPQEYGWSIQSIDWRKILRSAGQQSRVRQTGVNVASSKTFDVHWAFTYQGVVRQNDATLDSQKKWILTDRQTILDNTGISWDTTNEEVSMYLPYSPPYTGNVFSGGLGYSFGQPNFDGGNAGQAGVIAPSAGSTDHAIIYLPLTQNNDATMDLLYVHQGQAVFGRSGHQDMYGMWWLQF